MSLAYSMFVEPQQRFTIRRGAKTIGTGVFLEPLKPRTNEEKDPLIRRKHMKEVMERIGFNPYSKRHEERMKPNYENSPKDVDLIAKQFEGAAATENR